MRYLLSKRSNQNFVADELKGLIHVILTKPYIYSKILGQQSITDINVLIHPFVSRRSDNQKVFNYFFAIIILKYLPLIACSGKLLIKKMNIYILISIVISFLALNSYYFSPIATVRDYLAIFAAPIVNVFFVMIAGRIKIPKVKPLSILHLIIYGSYANSIMTILQQILGPRHWLSIGVTGEFDSHTYGGGLIAKANGIFANSNGIFQAVTVIVAFALLSLGYNQKSRYKLILKLSIALSVISAIINITSRTYGFSVIGTFLICLLYGTKSLLKPRTIILSFIFIIVGLVVFQDPIQNVLSSDSVLLGLNRLETDYHYPDCWGDGP